MIVSGSCSFWKGFSLVVKYRLVLERGLIFKEFRTKSTIVLLNCWIVGCFQSRACLPSPSRTLSQKYNLNLRIKTELVTAGADLKYLNWYLDHKQDIYKRDLFQSWIVTGSFFIQIIFGTLYQTWRFHGQLEGILSSHLPFSFYTQ